MENEAVTRRGNIYHLSDHLVQLVSTPAGTLRARLRRLLTPNLVDVHLQTGLVASLAVLHRTDAVFIQTIFTHRTFPILRQLPDRAPAHCTAAGKLLLALHPGRCTDYPRLAAATSSTITDRAALERELGRIRADGIATSQGEYVDGMVGVAAPVIGRHGHAVAALAAGGPADRTDLPSTATLLRRSAHAASLVMRRDRTVPSHA